MHSKARFIFYTVLAIYLITIFTVSYVGVYLTYFAIPVIVISGLIMRFTKPKPVTELQQNVHDSVRNTFAGINSTMGTFSSGLKKYNAKFELIQQRTKSHKLQIHQLNLNKIEPELNLKYEEDPTKRAQYDEQIDLIEKKIEMIEAEIEEIQKTCELEIERQYQQ